ncbi:uncharacterized protein LACBIDRAFT_316282 [Laccaria bicolor S238N-H82]|uniref:Predicted protein n=1 Tax=Laccaria bicolor (strain S238N-H82 / ATCC MYA-4686) TaxID=486041 RepID=B0E0L9_LACBS|nr:uncharacterized protein LACBIDRAFT_316282 [Laccaria bicolor S238N-H82]EDQ99610.1 predicted protein [Laccaria bicolor S238N-H82]|eukprot:XP_001889721.1 predicted protein [Laccaria bicolor S238N-H82]
MLDQAKRMRMNGRRSRIWIAGRISNTLGSTLQVAQFTHGLLSMPSRRRTHSSASSATTLSKTLVFVMIYRRSLRFWCREEACMWSGDTRHTIRICFHLGWTPNFLRDKPCMLRVNPHQH